ncbi:hypothetical protein H6F76_25715 [Leptolyngbya sp. FACHB-321]|uniref:hypothetical protein n=1 Tax=Leptolyngbya sp. FACHB-321 TaxID=2692807 RepID=UPI0016857A1C|nr:hypothetical protein [Leptolyngbya sp. FACHB-321]MBD2038355.1 hypothetical protein [Leptolyngbya sp. FACHB-321]
MFKKVLGWLASGSEVFSKPIVLLNTSPRATYVQALLTEIVTIMTGRIVSEASITISLLGRNLDAPETVADPEILAALQAAIATFVKAIQQI